MKYAVLETPYGDHFIPLDKFKPEGYRALYEEYKNLGNELAYDPLIVRKHMRAYIWDEETGTEDDIPGLSGLTFEGSPEQVD